ncbi:MAG: hypothetical protein AABX90_03555 [Nanoarchaeota archaeon]
MKKLKPVIIGSIVGLITFTVFGILTVIIPNNFFIRMTPIYWYDYIFLVLTSALIGIYVGFWYYTKKTTSKCRYGAVGGTAGGLFSFGCPICNKLLVLLLGFTGVMTYFAPLQPILGIASISVLGFVVYKQYQLLPRGIKAR